MRLVCSFLLLLTCLGPACSGPEGKGVVAGELFIEGCDGLDHYGTSSFPAYFDLRANYVLGEPVQDESDFPVAHRLDVRLQRGSNSIEDADGLYIQFSRVAVTAKRFAAHRLIPVAVGESVQATLALYLICPTFFDGPEAHPSGDVACPEVSAEEQDRLCEETVFGRLEVVPTPQAPFSQGHSCILLCKFGSARRNEPVADSFEINYEDEVSGIYFFSLSDRRIIYNNLEICSDGIDNNGDGRVDEEDCTRLTSGGFVQGNFSFKAHRAKSVQVIP